MAREVSDFPNSRTDEIVKHWMQREGINLDLVNGYSIERSASGSWINLKCWFDDSALGSPARAEASGFWPARAEAPEPERLRTGNGRTFVRVGPGQYSECHPVSGEVGCAVYTREMLSNAYGDVTPDA